MLRDNLVGLIVPMRSCGTQALGDEFSYLENPRPVGAESSLTGRCSSPFQTEPRQDWFADHPYLESSLAPTDIVLDHTITISPTVPPEKWTDFYRTALKNLQPGVTEFVIHLAFADEEMKAATLERDTWGAAWRQRDFDFFRS